MSTRSRYKRRPGFLVTAVRLDLDCEGFTFKKWGNDQTCEAGDWLVYNHMTRDTYTIKHSIFRTQYQEVRPGIYEKIGPVWAEVADSNGSIETREGKTDYMIGDYLVFDREEGGIGYAIKKATFERMYELIEPISGLTNEQRDYLRFIENRLAEYEKSGKINQNLAYLFQLVAIASAVSVPVLSSAGMSSTLIATLGGVSAAVSSVLSLFQFQNKGARFRLSAEDLRSHLNQYHVGAGVYEDRHHAFTLLVENCERMLSAERGQWVQQSSKASDDEDGGSGSRD